MRDLFPKGSFQKNEVEEAGSNTFCVPSLVATGALTEIMASHLAAAVQGRLNIVIAGGTGGGKTSLLDALGRYIPARELIVTIEDLAELRLEHPQCLSLEGRPPNVEGRGEITLSDLVREALRMRPDRLIIGEVRAPKLSLSSRP